MTFGEGFLVNPDLFPGRRSGEPWGDRSLALDIPGGPYTFSGLSLDQEAGVRERFGDLCRTKIGPTEGEVETRVFTAPPGDFRELDVRGWEYTLDLDHGPEAVRFAGLRLMARLDLAPLPAGGLWTPEAAGDRFAPALENFLRALAAYRLLERDGAVLHAAAVVAGEAAFLFLGPSGAGKTTVSRLCLERGGTVLSDDLNAVVVPEGGPEGGPVRVEKLPFTGDLGEAGGGPASHRLTALLRLVQGTEDRLTPISPARALAALLAAAPYVNRDPWRRERLMATLERMARGVPAYDLTFSLGGGLWDILKPLRQ
jgi:hypothetical protein